MHELCDDLAAEHAALDDVLVGVPDWDLATPAAGWSIRDSVSHLWFFDQRALLALRDPDAFTADMVTMIERGVDASIEPGRSMRPDELLGAWRRDAAALVEFAATVEPDRRVPWYGPAMGARSFVTARLMETWAHGQDVVDAIGAERPATNRLRHVAHIGVRARPFSYLVNGRDVPDGDIHVALSSPSGDVWTWGSESSTDRVVGSALDFCLVVTQRRHLSDTDLQITGAAALEWMQIAQAFAGPAGGGRAPVTDRR